MIYFKKSEITEDLSFHQIWAASKSPFNRRTLIVEKYLPIKREKEDSYLIAGYRCRFLDSMQLDFPKHESYYTGKDDIKDKINNSEIHSTLDECLQHIFDLNYFIIAAKDLNDLCSEYLAAMSPRTPEGEDQLIENLDKSLETLKINRVVRALNEA
jgi:hypothetical protein